MSPKPGPRGVVSSAARDPVLRVLVALLLATLVAFLVGWLPYPFGTFVLIFAIIARLLQLKLTRRAGERGPAP